MYAMIFSHLPYCITSWSQASQTTLKPIMSFYNQTIKIQDKKPIWHYCHMLERHNLFCFESFTNYCNLKLLFKWLHGRAPSMFNELVVRNQISSRLNTQRSLNRNCCMEVSKTSYVQSAFSATGAKLWNSLHT